VAKIRLQIKGRPIAKKNSKRVWRGPGGRPILVPSKAYKRFEGDAVVQLIEQQQQIKNSFDCPCHLELEFHIKGKYKVDIDNLISSICDILELTGVVENDNLITSVSAKKTQGAKDWLTEIVLFERG
jgi:Holliday junction resolvase RusA-like endonuclease